MWKERNIRIFVNESCGENEVFEMAKWRLCDWLAGTKEFWGCCLVDFYRSWEGCLGGRNITKVQQGDRYLSLSQKKNPTPNRIP